MLLDMVLLRLTASVFFITIHLSAHVVFGSQKMRSRLMKSWAWWTGWWPVVTSKTWIKNVTTILVNTVSYTVVLTLPIQSKLSDTEICNKVVNGQVVRQILSIQGLAQGLGFRKSCKISLIATWAVVDSLNQPLLNLQHSYKQSSHHHHHVVPPAWISLTISRHFSLSFIASGRSSGLHPVSSHSCCM